MRGPAGSTAGSYHAATVTRVQKLNFAFPQAESEDQQVQQQDLTVLLQLPEFIKLNLAFPQKE
jgi:hypothetical protein